jgi:hypothetical protein
MSDALVDYDVRVPVQTELASNLAVEVVSEIGTMSCVHYNTIVPVMLSANVACDMATRGALARAFEEP